jgi:hypothetical protein
MNARLESIEEEVSRWPHVSVHPHRFAAREYRFHKPKSAICILAASSTFLSRDRFAMRFWAKVLQKSISGFPTRVGLPSVSAHWVKSMGRIRSKVGKCFRMNLALYVGA